MYVKKIVAKNFIIPGKQKFVFDDDQNLISGDFYNIKELPLINEILNGKWQEHTNSFELFYPKFARKTEDMDLQIDTLIEISEEELEALNVFSLKLYGIPQTSRAWYYSIKCVYPFIFPVVSLVPAENPKDRTFGVGSHYDKFIKANSSKRELLTVAGMNAVGLLREKYFEYRKMAVRTDEVLLHKRYLDVIKSTFRYDEQFIKRIGQALYAMDDGDIISFGDQADFFFRNKLFIDFINAIPLMRENPKIKYDFQDMIYECYLRDLQWVYSVKTSNDILEIRKIIHNACGEKPISLREFQSMFKFNLSYDKKLDISKMQKEWIDDPNNQILQKEKVEPLNMFEKEISNVNLEDYDNNEEIENLNIIKSSIKEEKMKVKLEQAEKIAQAKREIEFAKQKEKRLKLEEKEKIKEKELKLKEKEAKIKAKAAKEKKLFNEQMKKKEKLQKAKKVEAKKQLDQKSNAKPAAEKKQKEKK